MRLLTNYLHARKQNIYQLLRSTPRILRTVLLLTKPSREKRKPLKLNNAPTWIFQNRKILANETSGILPRRVVNKTGPKRMITSTNTNIMQISNKIPLLKLHLRRQWHGGIQPTGDDKKNKLLKGLFSNTVIYKKCFSHSSDTRLANLTNCKSFLTKF